MIWIRLIYAWNYFDTSIILFLSKPKKPISSWFVCYTLKSYLIPINNLSPLTQRFPLPHHNWIGIEKSHYQCYNWFKQEILRIEDFKIPLSDRAFRQIFSLRLTNVVLWKSDSMNMETYAQRGARMLSSSCCKGKCFQCIWATMAAVIIEYDWGVRQKYRFESFCYGPKSCKFYKMGKPRAVPYKDEGSCYDDGCLDEILTEGRGWDE